VLRADGSVDGLTFATTGGGVGAGVGYRQLGSDDPLGWWTVSSGASLRIARQLAFGSTVNWQLPDGGDNNFVSWDLGAAWRPTPWLGVAGSVENLGNPAPDLGVATRWGAGAALRPFGDALTFSADWRMTAPPDTDAAHNLEASFRLRPTPGLWVRVFGSQDLSNLDNRVLGASIQINAADVGVGVNGRAALGQDEPQLGFGGWVQTIPRDDQLMFSGRDVAVFEFDERWPYQPQGGLLSAPEEGYLSLLRRLRDAGRDHRVRGLLLELDELPFSFAQIEELRELVLDARARGKPIAAYLKGNAGNGAYLLATACDRIYVHPAANLDLVGLSAEMMYLRSALDLVGVEAQYARRGKYKSAPEQFIGSQSSEPAREQMGALLDDLSGVLSDAVARGRGRPAADVQALIDGGPYTAEEAVAGGLVDGALYRDELGKALEGVFPERWNPNDAYGADPDTSGWAPQRAIAVIVVDGVIAPGSSSPGNLLGGAATGSRTVVKALEQAARANAVKAVVLRVDSPGGSAFASDEIWRAVERFKETGKPLVVSMGGYAASGGYYVSAGADAIYAMPSTVTGSIGIYGGKFNGADLLDKIDVTVETYTRGRHAAMYSIARPFDDSEFAALDRMIADGYRQFKSKVEVGRNLTPERVEELAQGHVWSGKAARERGLVDDTGGFYDAVERARRDAGLRADVPYSLVVFDPWVPDGDDLPARVVRAPRDLARALAPKIELPEALTPFWQLAALRDEHVFAMLPWTVTIR
jgi:protease-4